MAWPRMPSCPTTDVEGAFAPSAGACPFRSRMPRIPGRPISSCANRTRVRRAPLGARGGAGTDQGSTSVGLLVRGGCFPGMERCQTGPPLLAKRRSGEALPIVRPMNTCVGPIARCWLSCQERARGRGAVTRLSMCFLPVVESTRKRATTRVGTTRLSSAKCCPCPMLRTVSCDPCWSLCLWFGERG